MKKALPGDYFGRFREIVSDPLNLLIKRDVAAGTVVDEHVILHNGLRVARSGPLAYYDNFSDILVINRGVHEPLEEYVFQEVLKRLPQAPVMLELGAYWGHYSMWLKKLFPQAVVHLVEPSDERLKAGRVNFAQNGYEGIFVQARVGKGDFEVDAYFQTMQTEKLNLLHSDIQGAEVEMLQGASDTLYSGKVDYLFISTHGPNRHSKVLELLKKYNYRIEVSSDFTHETTSFDGFVMACHPDLESVFPEWVPLGRKDILKSSPRKLVKSLQLQLNR